MDPNSSTKLQTHDSIKSSSHGFPLNNKIMMAAVVVLFSIVLLILAVHLYVRYFIYRRRNSLQNRRLFFASGAGAAKPRGLDSKVLSSIPVVVYEADAASDDEAVECAVCLCEIEDGEKVRVLPRCEHCFHVGCIDMWFGSHGSCPLCRSAVDDVADERKIEQLCTEGEAGSSSSESDESFVSIEIEDERIAETGSSTVESKSNFVDLARNYFSRSRRLNGNDDVAAVAAEV